jgi:hypothetical protein
MRLKRTTALAIALWAGFACMSLQAQTAAPAESGDGHDIANAIVIKASNERDGVKAEYRWIAEHFPGYKRGRQALLNQSNRSYDELDFTTASGEPKTVYFDISDFFGKM